MRGETDERPWGRYEVLEESEGYKVKRLEIKPGARLSLQRHAHRLGHADDPTRRRSSNAATNTTIATLPVGSRPAEDAISGDGKHLYVDNQQDNTVSVVTLGW